MRTPARPAYTPTIQELRALVLAADSGSVSAAADALSLTQSAVSRSISALEHRLGVRLFRRERQRIVLSDAGRAMTRDARDILERIDATARMVMAFGGGSEVLRLAVLPTFATTWLIPRLAGFSQRNPQISIDISQALLPVDFASSPFDAAIQRIDMARPGTSVTPLCQERLIVVASPDLVPQSDQKPLSLLDYPLIQQATRPELWSQWLELAGLDPFQQLRGPRFEHFDMIMAAAQAGMGVALLPDIFVSQALASERLIHLFSEVVFERSQYALIRPASLEQREAVDLLSAWLIQGSDPAAFP
jgi:LysR family glycine cleavage system transcriptional activator